MISLAERIGELKYVSQYTHGVETPSEAYKRALKDAAKLAAEGEDDSKRLAWFAQHSGFDGFGGIDIHEEASIAASVFAREEPNSEDYLFAMRRAIDAAMKGEGDE
jgi:hypothetical protein